MLNGIDPIIIFNFSKLEPDLQAAVANIPVVSNIVNKIGLPPIPIYLSERLTGLFIDSEEKSIDIETTTETLTSGSDPVWQQKGINSTVKINMIANKNSLGMTLLGALADLVFEKVTSKEYSITYIHGSTTIFNGLLHSFSISQQADSDLMQISAELTRSTGKPTPKTSVPVVDKITGALPL